MKRLKRLYGAVVAVAAVALCLLGLQAGTGSAARADTVPAVTGVSPDSGPDTGGTPVVITGTGFTNATQLHFGGGAGVPFTIVSDTEITATSPAGSGVADVVVTSNAGSSAMTSQDWFIYKSTAPPPPRISGISPTVGPTSGGQTMTITGSGFTGTTSVTFNGAAATNVTVVSDTELTLTTPPQSPGRVAILVFTPNGNDISEAYTYADTPVVTGISPSSGPANGGSPVIITGSGFTGTTTVLYGSVPAVGIDVINDTTISAPQPPQAAGTVVDVTVTNPAGTSAVVAADQFTYTAAVTTATSFTPAGGPSYGGTVVTVTGTDFVAGQTSVTLGGTVLPAASVTVTSPSTLTFTTPAHDPGFAVISVTTPSATAAVPGLGFSYRPPTTPVVTAVAPAAGPTTGGTTVTITGGGFTGVTGVTFGSTSAASYTVNSAESITAVTPPGVQGATGVRVSSHLGSGGGPGIFTYVTPPTVTSVSPASASTAGGTTVTITGTGFKGYVPSFGSLPFTGAAAVSFGSAAASSFTVVSDTTITAVTPAAPAGAVDVTVTNSGGTSATSAADQFTFQVPAPVCTTTITGTHSTQLTVASGLTCLVGAKQNGSVTVAAGASLSVTNSTVNGTVTAVSPGSVTYCGSTENGTLTVSGATGPVTIGDGRSCAADTVPSLIKVTGSAGAVTVNGLKENGTLTLSGDTGGVTLNGSSVSGAVYVQNNAGPAVTVAGNTVTGSLYCTGNTPAPADNGSVNTVSGTATSQCAAIAQR